MPGKSGIDRSGHITMTMSEVNFYNAIARKAERADFLRAHGFAKSEVGRNPILAQKTPRKDGQFDNSVPEAPKQVDRWHYPETDWGLMAKFRSQKPIYDKILSMEQEYKEKVQEFNEKNIDVEASSGTIASSRNVNTITTTRDSIDELKSGRLTERTSRTTTTSRKDSQLPYEPNKLYDQNISTFKVVGRTNPEILAKWRAKRAADFVLTQTHPLEPPTSRILSDKLFKPAGVAPDVIVNKEFVKAKKRSHKPSTAIEPVDTARLQEKLGSLMSALNQTQSEIERQELKIALNNKEIVFYINHINRICLQ